MAQNFFIFLIINGNYLLQRTSFFLNFLLFPTSSPAVFLVLTIFFENGRKKKKKNQVWRFSIRESQLNRRGSGWIDRVWSFIYFSAESIGSEWHNAQYLCTLSPGRHKCKQYSCNWQDHRTRHCIHQHGSKFVSPRVLLSSCCLHSFIQSMDMVVFVSLSFFLLIH
jgi:hypothetical protein